jgi:hypothetical protein
MAVFPPAHNKYGPTYSGPRLARRNRATYPPNATRNASRARSDLGTAKSSVRALNRPPTSSSPDAGAAPSTVDRQGTGLAGVGIAYHLAEIALHTQPPDAPGIAVLDDRLPEALVAAGPRPARRLAAKTLGRVLDLEDEERQVLLETLQAWFRADRSATSCPAAWP